MKRLVIPLAVLSGLIIVGLITLVVPRLITVEGEMEVLPYKTICEGNTDQFCYLVRSRKIFGDESIRTVKTLRSFVYAWGREYKVQVKGNVYNSDFEVTQIDSQKITDSKEEFSILLVLGDTTKPEEKTVLLEKNENRFWIKQEQVLIDCNQSEKDLCSALDTIITLPNTTIGKFKFSGNDNLIVLTDTDTY